jgi:uncharacterized membrane protein YidH (DUF202 family)
VTRDPGLQPERTALAWRRTALAMLVNGALLVRAASEARSPALWTVSLLVVAAACGIWGIGWHRRSVLAVGGRGCLHAAVPLLVTGCTLLACAAALLSLLSLR